MPDTAVDEDDVVTRVGKLDFDAVGLPPVVVIAKSDPFALRLPNESSAGGANPAVLLTDHTNAGEVSGDVGGAVAGAIVEHEDLVRLHGLALDGLQRFS